MKQVYPVFITKVEGAVLVEIPDFGLLTEGTDLSDALEHARDVIYLSSVVLEENGEEIPKPSNILELDTEKATFINEGETLASLLDVEINNEKYKKMIDNKTVRRNVSLPAYLNDAATEADINVSAILQKALKEELGL